MNLISSLWHRFDGFQRRLERVRARSTVRRPGPAEAVRRFLETDNSFEVDPSRKKFEMTFNPGGDLRRGEPGAR